VKTFWMIAAALCAATAVFFAVRGVYDNAFIAAVLGAVAWFLNYRTHLRDKLGDTDQADEEDTDFEDTDREET
jgi:uncharacterized membrane protein YdjX (TVP38/TMEM64 family)